MISSIAVFSGSRMGRNPKFQTDAVRLGQLIAGRGLKLVYGGGHVGLMGAIADAALSAGGKVAGVIPEGLFERERLHEGLTELHVTDSMHARKAKMAMLADAFIVLPGGFGTLDESCEIITWAQIGLHSKPIGLLNTDGFWDGFLEFAETAVQEGFIPAEHLRAIRIARTPEELLGLF